MKSGGFRGTVVFDQELTGTSGARRGKDTACTVRRQRRRERSAPCRVGSIEAHRGVPRCRAAGAGALLATESPSPASPSPASLGTGKPGRSAERSRPFGKENPAGRRKEAVPSGRWPELPAPEWRRRTGAGCSGHSQDGFPLGDGKGTMCRHFGGLGYQDRVRACGPLGSGEGKPRPYGYTCRFPPDSSAPGGSRRPRPVPTSSRAVGAAALVVGWKWRSP